MSNEPQLQNQQYLSRAYSLTRSYLASAYSSQPLRYKIQFSFQIFQIYRVPQLVETTFKRLDEITDPYVNKVTQIMDKGVDSTIVILAPLAESAKQVGQKQVVQRYQGLVDQGRQLSTKIQVISQELLKDGVNLAIHNKASQVVLGGADAVSDRVFSSIEDKIHQLSVIAKVKVEEENKKEKPEDKGKGGSWKNYHTRIVDLAQDISKISNHLYFVLRTEVQQRQEGNKVTLYLTQARSLVQAHFQASCSVICLTVVTPSLALISSSQTLLGQYISVLRGKMTDKQLVQFLKEQILAAKDQLTREQMLNIYNVLKNIEYYNKVKESILKEQTIYSRELKNQKQQQQQSQAQTNGKQDVRNTQNDKSI